MAIDKDNDLEQDLDNLNDAGEVEHIEEYDSELEDLEGNDDLEEGETIEFEDDEDEPENEAEDLKPKSNKRSLITIAVAGALGIGLFSYFVIPGILGTGQQASGQLAIEQQPTPAPAPIDNASDFGVEAQVSEPAISSQDSSNTGEIVVDLSASTIENTKKPLSVTSTENGLQVVLEPENEVSLDFVESSDFRTLAFIAFPGEPGSNPEIRVNSGDEVTITANNVGKSFHSFGVVSNPDDFNNVIFDSAIAAATNPLKPGESGDVTFLAGAPGTYYYICTVPGHALQGMQGSFIIE